MGHSILLALKRVFVIKSVNYDLKVTVIRKIFKEIN